MSEQEISVGAQPEHSYEPEIPSYWYKLGKQDALEGGDPRTVDVQWSKFQVDYDEGYRAGKYIDPIENRETI